MDHLVGATVCANAFEEATGDPAVAFRPGERALFSASREENSECRPGGVSLGERAVSRRQA